MNLQAAAKKLSLFDFSLLVISFVIGMGIFRTPANVAREAGEPFIFFAAWAAGGLIAICGALTYAEIGCRYPVTGGYYRIFSYAYHPSIAFAVNCIILVSNAASMAGVALIGAEYISAVLLPNSALLKEGQIAIAIFCILVFYGVNMLGLHLSAKTQNVLTIIKILMVIMLIAPLFFAKHPPQILQSVTGNENLWMNYIKGFGLGLVGVSFTYGGYQQCINFGEEVNNPSKNIPRAVFIGLSVIVILYLLINYAYVQVIGFEELKTTKNISSVMAEKVLGPIAGNVMSVLLFLSVLAYVNAVLLSNPRVMQAMGEDGVLPKTFAKRTAKRNVLFSALTAFTVIGIFIIFWAETFDKILKFTIFLDCIGMALSAATIFKIRKETAHLNDTGIYQMKFFPLMPIIFILAYTFVAISIFIDDPKVAMQGIGILALFTGLYFLFRKKQSGN